MRCNKAEERTEKTGSHPETRRRRGQAPAGAGAGGGSSQEAIATIGLEGAPAFALRPGAAEPNAHTSPFAPASQ